MPNKTHGSLAAQAAAYLTESAGAMGGFNGIQSEIRRQACWLLKWARERGLRLPNFYPVDIGGLEKYPDATREHVVYFGSSNDRVIKCTKPGCFGYGHGSDGKFGNHCAATPLFYLQRIELMNQEFPTDLRLEGIALGKSEFGPKGGLRPYIVTSQVFIERDDSKPEHPSEGDIESLMTELGFSRLENSYYNWIRKSDGIVVTDARELNFIFSITGIVPIDVIISKIED